MNASGRLARFPAVYRATLLAGFLLATAGALAAGQAGAAEGSGQWGRDSSRPAPVCEPSVLDSPYIPVDSWVYPAVLRLYSLDFVDSVYLGMRPWTRSSLDHALEEAGARIEDADAGPATDEAQEIYEALIHALRDDIQGPCLVHEGNSRVESVYTVARAISGTPLRDSYHLGSTVINDYDRPYASGFNNYSGASGYASAGRFLLYARGEFQGAPSTAGYSAALAGELAADDGTTDFFNSAIPIPYNQQATIPAGPIAAATDGRLMEAYVSAHYLNHEISFGKQDDWLGPGLGGGMAYSNNAENIYSFRINRIEPLRIPLLSMLTGPFRYEFLVGSLKGHTYPNDPWVHVEKVSFKPTPDLEFGFERTVIWGGEGHEPITIKSFLRSFFSVAPSTFLTVFPSSASGSLSTRIRKCMTMSPPSTLRGAPPGGPACICPMCPAFPSWTFAPKPPPPIRPSRAALTASSCTMRASRGRATPTRANCLATGSVARTREARVGLPII
jgi:hypothetical protein